MSLQRQQDFLARLFTDENLRRNFLSDPDRTGLENGLTENESADLRLVLPEQLDFFADSLFWKRLREAEKFLPLTRKLLKERFSELFREFARNYNPASVKKHLEDAAEFCRYLQNAEIEPVYIKDAARFELGKLEFFGYGKRFVCKKLNYDISQITDGETGIKKKTSYFLWISLGGKIKHFRIPVSPFTFLHSPYKI